MQELEIYSILKEFYKISGFRISIHDLDFNEIYSYPEKLSPFCRKIQEFEQVKQKCLETDKKAFLKVQNEENVYIYKCSCGLYEAVAPVYNYGVLAGYLMMGQITDSESESYNNILKKNYSFFADQNEAVEYVNNITVIEKSLINSYINLMTIIAGYITKSNKLNSNNSQTAELIKKYINRNFNKAISLEYLSEKFAYSKTTIMTSFKKEYGISVMLYLKEVRLKKANELCVNSNLSLKEISAMCGFSDQNYFSKVFNKEFNMPPAEFRKKFIRQDI